MRESVGHDAIDDRQGAFLRADEDGRKILQDRGLRLLGHLYIAGFLKFEAPVVIEGLSARCSTIGAFTTVAPECQMHFATVGRFCSIADKVMIGPYSHPTSRVTTSSHLADGAFSWFSPSTARYDYVDHTPVNIGNDVWIGTRVIIKGGVSIGDGAVLGSGAVITKDVEPYSIVGGVPAKEIRRRFPKDILERMISLKPWMYDLREHAQKEAGYFSEVTDDFLDRLELGIKEGSLRRLESKTTQISQTGDKRWSLEDCQ